MYHTVAGIMFIQPGGQFLKNRGHITHSLCICCQYPAYYRRLRQQKQRTKKDFPAFGLTVTGAQFFNNSGQIQIGILEQYQQVIEQIR